MTKEDNENVARRNADSNSPRGSASNNNNNNNSSSSGILPHYHRSDRTEGSESSLLRKLDASRGDPHADGFRAAVRGETAPLGNRSFGRALEVLSGGDRAEDNDASAGHNASQGIARFKNAANKVRQMQTASKLAQQVIQRPQNKRHQRVASLLASIDDNDEDNDAGLYGMQPPQPPPPPPKPPTHPGLHRRANSSIQSNEELLSGHPAPVIPGATASTGHAHESPTSNRTKTHARVPSNLNETLHAGTIGDLLLNSHVDPFEDSDQRLDLNAADLRTDTGNAVFQAQRGRTWSYGAQQPHTHGHHRRRTSSISAVKDENVPLLYQDIPDQAIEFAISDDGASSFEYLGSQDDQQQLCDKPNACLVCCHYIAHCICSIPQYISYVLQWTLYHFFHSTLPLALACSIASLVIFYRLRNPEFDFLPGSVKLSWWLNFAARQCVTFEIARIVQWFVIDWFALGTRWGPKFLGPLSIIVLVQSKGFPFLVSMWGVVNACLLHGDDRFQVHWLYWTGMEVFNANSGNFIINSPEYTRSIVVLILMGMAVTTKRTVLTLYFGRRNFEIYKDKLEKILRDIIIVSEIADLAAEAAKIAEVSEKSAGQAQDQFKSMRPEDRKMSISSTPPRTTYGSGSTSGEHKSDSTMSASKTPEDLKDARTLVNEVKNKERGNGGTLQTVRWQSLKFDKKATSNSVRNVDDDDDDDETHSASSSTVGVPATYSDAAAKAPVQDRRGALQSKRRYFSRESSGHLPIKKLLDRWKEPMNKADQTTDASIHDIYKFRKALAYMDMDHPFAESFGPATTRDECIESAQNVYKRLMHLSPIPNGLSFSVLAVLAENPDGTQDITVLRAMKRLFRPDKGDQLSMLAFVQSCDNVYKKLRYFRASVGNSSVIDSVLEGIITGFFRLGLTLVLLSILKFNPWPLLVSMSTLLVTFAFAVGPSTSKAIEGVLLIVLRRPYDIGDRIVVADTPGMPINEIEAGSSWLVEDISLFTTTLRHGPTNAVATTSNGSLASARILNLARSPNAIIYIMLKLSIKVTDEALTQQYTRGIEQYVADHPRIWESFMYLRCEEVDPDVGYAIYRLCCRSRHNWQVSARILDDRGNLRKYCVKLGKELGVQFAGPMPEQVVHYGGHWKKPQPASAPGGGGPPTGDPAMQSEGAPADNSAFDAVPNSDGVDSAASFIQMVQNSMT